MGLRQQLRRAAEEQVLSEQLLSSLNTKLDATASWNVELQRQVADLQMQLPANSESEKDDETDEYEALKAQAAEVPGLREYCQALQSQLSQAHAKLAGLDAAEAVGQAVQNLYLGQDSRQQMARVARALADLDCPAKKGWYVDSRAGPENVARCGGGSHTLSLGAVVDILGKAGFGRSEARLHLEQSRKAWEGRPLDEMLRQYCEAHARSPREQGFAKAGAEEAVLSVLERAESRRRRPPKTQQRQQRPADVDDDQEEEEDEEDEEKPSAGCREHGARSWALRAQDMERPTPKHRPKGVSDLMPGAAVPGSDVPCADSTSDVETPQGSLHESSQISV